MPKVLVVFYSRGGNTAKLADAIAEGARSVQFTEVDVRRLDDLAPQEVIDAVPAWKASREQLARKYETLGSSEDLADYDAIVFGSPTRYGVMSAEMKNLFDQTGPLWARGALVNKVGAAFSGASTPHGGQEMTLQGLMTCMMHQGMIIVPPGYTDPIYFKAGSPYGATAQNVPTEDDLAAARHMGKRVAEVAEMIAHAQSHAH
jgi:NAD(P)H dehydrogenase (quinone)